MGKKQGQIYSDIDVVKSFLFTFEEYQRFSECFNRIQNRNDIYKEDSYVFIQTRLLMIRKYEAINDSVYLRKVLEAFQNIYPEYITEVSALLQKLNDIEGNPLEIYLSDGTKRTLRETIEDILYGMYLHAEKSRIETLIKTNISTYMFAVEKYVLYWDALLTETYNLINSSVMDKYSRDEFEKASIVFTGEDNSQGQDIKSAPYWSNLRGRDTEKEEIAVLIDKLTLEEKIILNQVNSFITELKKNDYSKTKLRKMIHPAVKSYWGDFITIHNEIVDVNLGFSNKVRFNESHNIAYVLLFKNLPPDGSFIINQPQYSEDIAAIYLKKDSENGDWKIFSANIEPDKLIKTVTIDPNRIAQRIFDFVTSKFINNK